MLATLIYLPRGASQVTQEASVLIAGMRTHTQSCLIKPGKHSFAGELGQGCKLSAIFKLLSEIKGEVG